MAVALGDRLHALAHRILRDRELAGDVTQQTLVKIWQELPRLRDAELFAGWSYRILVNTCRDEMRKRRRSSEDLDLLESDAWMPGVSIPIADRDQLERAFRRLTVDQRSVLILHYYLDFSLAEIGSIVDIPVGTVRSPAPLREAGHALRHRSRSPTCSDRRAVGMTPRIHFDDQLRAWADLGDERLPVQYLKAALAQIDTSPQRRLPRGWLEFPHMNRYATYALAAALIVVAALISISLLVRPPDVGPTPLPPIA